MDISVVIITKDRCALLKRAITSVLSQTEPIHELIVVDDASSDDTQEYLHTLPKVKVLRNKSSIGGANSRNKGVEAATGDVVAFLDDDDYWDPGKLSFQKEVMESSSADICYTGTLVEDENGDSMGSCFHKAQFSDRIQICLLNHIGITSTVLIKRELLLENSFDPEMPALQEYELYIRLIAKGAKVVGVPQPLVHYLQVSNAGSVSASAKANREASKRILKKHGKGIYYFLHRIGLTRILLQKLVRSKHFRKDYINLLFKLGSYGKK